MNEAAKDSQALPTFSGLAALALWSTSVATSRGMTESLGVLTGGAMAAALGGTIATLVAWAFGQPPSAMLRLPPRYLWVCGGLFVAYELCWYTAIGWAPNRSTVLLVAVLNYLWPALTVALSVPILKRRAGWSLGLGCAMAVCGTAVAVLGCGPFRWSQLNQAGLSAVGPLIIAAVGGIIWALYSNLVKRWGRPEAGAVPLFLLATGAALGLMRLARTEQTVWTRQAAGELAFIALATSALAYSLWEAGMRRGRHLLLSLASYFSPIASLSVAAAYLRVAPGWPLILGCVLVTAGAIVCRFSVTDATSPPSRGALPA